MAKGIFRISCAIWLAVCAKAVTAQNEVPTARQVREMGGSVPALISGPPSKGKEVYFAQGIQGEIGIQGIIDVDGTIHDASIALSSRSSDLDAFALGLITKSAFSPAKDKSGQPIAVRVTIPVYLWKDSLADGSLFSKRCSDFVLDADWHARAFPEQQPNQLRSWLLINGGTFAFRLANGAQTTTTPDFQAVYNVCRKKPSRKFSDVFLGR